VILLHQGRIIEDGTPAGLIATYGRDTLEEVFLDVVRGRAQQARDSGERSAVTELKAS
jgi:ABC-2 type transport system ATP-binding protein